MLTFALAVTSLAEEGRIEVKAGAFSEATYLSEHDQTEVSKTGALKGYGEATYRFTMPQTGWYELWVEAVAWPTDLFLDGQFLIHTPFASGVWPAQGKAEKVINLYLSQGEHVLKFSHLWHPGLPYLRRFFLEPAKDVSGKVRLIPRKDALAFRKGEPFPVRLMAERQPETHSLMIQIIDVEKDQTVHTIEQPVSPGESLFEADLTIPTDREGVFDVKITDNEGRAVDRTIQYLVVDTETVPPSAPVLQKDLLMRIDPVVQPPDYASGETQVVKAPFGTYRESGTKGYYEHRQDADFFAYTLKLPTIQEPYLVEVEYPDDDQRTFTISLMEKDINPYPLDSGVTSGGPYSLSHQTQTHKLFFYPRQLNPRLFFLNWRTGQRAAVSEIRVYRIPSGFPTLLPGAAGRWFGMYFEEPLRFTTYFGAMPVGNSWLNLFQAAERWARWSRYIGANFWLQTIAVYQSMMWPGQTIPSYGMADEDGFGVIGPATLKEPFKKDLMRLMLLVCEKYGLDFVGELHIPGNEILLRTLDKRFGGNGDLRDDSHEKPWLTVSKDGKAGVQNPWMPYFNPLYPGVQDWLASVVHEIAERYKDSPAFKGVAIRLLGWTFSSWQAFPSISWGYDDYTVDLFQKETGLVVPVSIDDPARFTKRYDWLMAHAYEQWVAWRCMKIRQYYNRLAGILTEERPDLKLSINAFGPHYAPGDWAGQQQAEVAALDEKGWLKTIREAGIDPSLYRDDPRIVLSDARSYPPGILARGPNADYLAAARWDASFDSRPIEVFSKGANPGTVSAVRFYNEYMEADFSLTRIGLEQTSRGARNTTRICGVLNPAGRHMLVRYANAMADGNLTFISDGGLGYILGQPDYLREFMAEYRSLLAIGMVLDPRSGDPVALWSGHDHGRLYLYLVNRAYYPVEVTLRFSAGTMLKRLSSGEPLALAGDGTLHLKLQPYQLLAFVNETDGSEPIAFEVQVPEEIKRQLQSQMDFVADLLDGQSSSSLTTTVSFSSADRQQAARVLTQARQDYKAGRYWSVRQTLMDHPLVKVFHALDTYPPDLFHSKAPERPQGAMLPEALLERATTESRQLARIEPASLVAPPLTGLGVLVWKGGPFSFNLNAPFLNRYRLSFAYVKQLLYDRPVFFIDGQKIPGQDALFQETTLWGRKTILKPLSLSSGRHTITIYPPGRQSRVGLFHVHLEPLYRDIVAREWNVIGPFGGYPHWRQAGMGLEMVYPPEVSRDFQAVYRGSQEQTVSWIHTQTAEDYVNLFKLTGALSDSISYAVTTIYSPEARLAQLRFGVDYWAKLWLNAQQVFQVTESHNAPQKGEFTVPVWLKKGANELLVKVHAGSAGNGLWLSISDPGDLVVRPAS